MKINTQQALYLINNIFFLKPELESIYFYWLWLWLQVHDSNSNSNSDSVAGSKTDWRPVMWWWYIIAQLYIKYCYVFIFGFSKLMTSSSELEHQCSLSNYKMEVAILNAIYTDKYTWRLFSHEGHALNFIRKLCHCFMYYALVWMFIPSTLPWDVWTSASTTTLISNGTVTLSFSHKE